MLYVMCVFGFITKNSEVEELKALPRLFKTSV